MSIHRIATPDFHQWYASGGVTILRPPKSTATPKKNVIRRPPKTSLSLSAAFLNQIQVAEALGVHTKTLRRWVRQQRFPQPIPRDKAPRNVRHGKYSGPNRRDLFWTRDSVEVGYRVLYGLERGIKFSDEAEAALAIKSTKTNEPKSV